MNASLLNAELFVVMVTNALEAGQVISPKILDIGSTGEVDMAFPTASSLLCWKAATKRA